MKVLVVGGFEAASQKAHAINTIKMAQGFARLGHAVTVVCRRPINGSVAKTKLAQIYGLTESMEWIQIPSQILGLKVKKGWGFSLLAVSVLLKRLPDLVYTRSYIFPWISCQLRFFTVAEKHTAIGHRSSSFHWLVKATYHPRFVAWVTISHRLLDYYSKQGAIAEKILVLPDAVDLELFQRPPDLPKSPYDKSRINVAYAGHLYEYKGIQTILKAAAQLPDFQFHLIGGLSADIQKQKHRAAELRLSNVIFHGLKPQLEVPQFLWHADILLLPPSKYHPSAAWTSPVKLAEYLATETPIIATSIPALRDWVTVQEVEFVPPDDPSSLATAIRRLSKDNLRCEQLRQAGFQKAKILTYENRVGAILRQIRHSLPSTEFL